MDAESESDASTAPLATPSPHPPTAAPPLRPSLSPSPSPAARRSPSPPSRPAQPVARSVEEEGQHAESGSLHLSQIRTSPDVSPKVRSRRISSLDELAETQSGRYTKISPRERSPIAVDTADAGGSQSRRSDRGSSSPKVSLRIRSHASGQQEVVTQTSIFRETRQTSQRAGEHTEEYEIRILSEETVESAKETTVVLEKTSPLDLSPLIECEDGSQATPAHSREAMETIEPTEENLLLAIRQASSGGKKPVVESGRCDTVEIAADDDLPDLEIEPPTPIRRSSRRVTPERSVRSTRTTRRAQLRKDPAPTFAEKAAGTVEPTPPKLRRVSPGRTTRASHDDGWFDEMPPLMLEASDDENSNDNHSEASPPSSPPRISSRKSVERSPPVSPSRSSSRKGVERSPPVSPSRRSSRKSVDRSPPVSPSRRSARKSADRSPPPSPSRRSSRRSEERGATPERTGRASKSSTVKVGGLLFFLPPPPRCLFY